MRFRNRNTPGQNRLSASREPEFQDTQDSDPVRGAGEGVAPKRMARGPPTHVVGVRSESRGTESLRFGRDRSFRFLPVHRNFSHRLL